MRRIPILSRQAKKELESLLKFYAKQCESFGEEGHVVCPKELLARDCSGWAESPELYTPLQQLVRSARMRYAARL